MRNIIVIIEREDDVFSASIPAINGVFTFSDSIERVKMRMHDALKLHIEGLNHFSENLTGLVMAEIKLTFKLVTYTEV